jgi:hypothetical protein
LKDFNCQQPGVILNFYPIVSKEKAPPLALTPLIPVRIQESSQVQVQRSISVNHLKRARREATKQVVKDHLFYKEDTTDSFN